MNWGGVEDVASRTDKIESQHHANGQGARGASPGQARPKHDQQRSRDASHAKSIHGCDSPGKIRGPVAGSKRDSRGCQSRHDRESGKEPSQALPGRATAHDHLVETVRRRDDNRQAE